MLCQLDRIGNSQRYNGIHRSMEESTGSLFPTGEFGPLIFCIIIGMLTFSMTLKFHIAFFISALYSVFIQMSSMQSYAFPFSSKHVSMANRLRSLADLDSSGHCKQCYLMILVMNCEDYSYTKSQCHTFLKLSSHPDVPVKFNAV